jgi:hypothetical protein
LLICAQVFWPVYQLHVKMRSYKMARARQFTAALKDLLAEIDHELRAGNKAELERIHSRLKVIRALDPATLRLATWPFDRTKLASYAFTPTASLLVPIGKDLLVHWLGVSFE